MQVGLAGSSALITALIKCLVEYYSLDISLDRQARLALLVETEELGCIAGMQDRFVQAYGGCVYMDFSGEVDVCTRLDLPTPGVLKGLWMAYLLTPENSGKVHSTVRTRWLNKDKDVVDAMRKLAVLACTGRRAIESGDRQLFARCMDENFVIRRSIYGDNVIGSDNIKIARIGNLHGFAVKFSGSGLSDSHSSRWVLHWIVEKGRERRGGSAGPIQSSSRYRTGRIRIHNGNLLVSFLISGIDEWMSERIHYSQTPFWCKSESLVQKVDEIGGHNPVCFAPTPTGHNPRLYILAWFDRNH